jgi:bifunctional non-homologous end joining protein LigD
MAATGRMAVRAAAATPVTFVIFDLLDFDGVDLTRLALLQRKQALEALGLIGPTWVVNPGIQGAARTCSGYAWNAATEVKFSSG